MTTEQKRLDALERDLRLSETLRTSAERDLHAARAEVTRLKAQIEEMNRVMKEQAAAITDIETQRGKYYAENQQLRLDKQSLTNTVVMLGNHKIEMLNARDSLLEENSRLVELRRDAEQDARVAKDALRAVTEQKLTLTVEYNRLLAGDFKPEEIHGFCHKLAETVSREEFMEGCRRYQLKLYGEPNAG